MSISISNFKDLILNSKDIDKLGWYLKKLSRKIIIHQGKIMKTMNANAAMINQGSFFTTEKLCHCMDHYDCFHTFFPKTF